MDPRVPKVLPYVEHWSSPEERQTFPNITPEAIQHELNLIQHTCETYPRNYHAWAHWHFIIDVCYTLIYFHSLITDLDEPGLQAGKRQDFLEIFIMECTRLRGWVDRNVSDYSAMHQLCQSQMLIEQLLLSGILVPASAKNLTASALVDQSLSLVTAFPSHESLWLYLRISLGNTPAENQTAILEEIKAKDAIVASPFVPQLMKWFAKT
jgi:protein prenyltransferase alpha subunit repeat containing protein 1